MTNRDIGTSDREPIGLSEADRQAVIEHMNGDHADALILYAQVFGGLNDVGRAVMTDIDRTSISLNVDSGDRQQDLEIPLDREVHSRQEIRATLVDMVKRARRLLGASS